MPDASSSSAVVRIRTDVDVVDRLLTDGELTRAEIASRTGISKPTVSQSIRRLTETGTVEESGRQSGKRGPAGTLVRLRRDLGIALAVTVGPAGVAAVVHDLHGLELERVHHAIGSPVRASRLGPVMISTVRAALATAPGPVLGVAVSMAGPVDQHTGRVVRLGYTPFLLDELAAADVIGTALGPSSGRRRPGQVLVDNDVNLASLAEHQHGAAVDLSQFGYVYLGAGVGGAVVIDGRVQHGSSGLAGELAHVLTVGAGGRAMSLTEALARLGLHRAGSVAIDLEEIDRVVEGATVARRRTRAALVDAVAGVLCSAVAALDPQALVVGGPWAGQGFDRLLAERVAERAVRPVEVRAAELGDEAPMVGARAEALRLARAAVRPSD